MVKTTNRLPFTNDLIVEDIQTPPKSSALLTLILLHTSYASTHQT